MAASLGDPARLGERGARKGGANPAGRTVKMIAKNAITDVYFAVAQFIVRCNITLAF
jgi:hypothetical protein